MDYETLSRLASKTVFTIDTGDIPPRGRNAVMRAIETGYLPVTSGVAAAYFRTVAEQYKLPFICMSERSKYGKHFTLHRVHMTDQMVQALSDWWKADRVAFRIAEPERYNEYATNKHSSYYYSNYLTEPNWRHLNRDRYPYVNILSDKNPDALKDIARIFVDTPQYQSAACEALALVSDGQAFEVEYKQAA